MLIFNEFNTDHFLSIIRSEKINSGSKFTDVNDAAILHQLYWRPGLSSLCIDDAPVSRVQGSTLDKELLMRRDRMDGCYLVVVENVARHNNSYRI